MEALGDSLATSKIKISWFVSDQKTSLLRDCFAHDLQASHFFYNPNQTDHLSDLRDTNILVGNFEFYEDLFLSLKFNHCLYFILVDESEWVDLSRILKKILSLSKLGFQVKMMELKEILNKENQLLNQSFVISQKKYEESNLTLQVKIQNKKLEELSLNLEQIVNERTHEISLSSKEESDKLQKNQKLIYFIKSLAEAQTYEDIFEVLRREIKQFHQLNDFYIVQINQNLNFKVFFRTKGVIRNFYYPQKYQQKKIYDILSELKIHPFNNIHIIDFNYSQKSGFKKSAENQSIKIIINHTMNEKELEALNFFIEERKSALGVAFERISFQEELDTFVLRWNKTFSGIKEPIAVIDTQFKVVKKNSFFQMDDLKNSCFMTFSQDHKPCFGCPIKKVFQTKLSQVSSISFQGQSYEVHSYPLRNKQTGEVESVFNQYINNTEEKHLYSQIIQNEKIGAIGQLAGHIAHELNNPLSGIRSLSQIILSETDPKAQIHLDLIEVEKAALRSQKIIKNLIDFSQPDKGELKEEKLDDIILRTLPLLKTSLRSVRQNILLNGPDIFIKIEAQLLQQVIFNIVNNACYALRGIEKGEVKINSYLENQFAVIQIADNGPGISPENLSKIFTPFYTTKLEGEGTGLGLSLSKSIVEKFGGILIVESQINQGATFYIKLPSVKPSNKSEN